MSVPENKIYAVFHLVTVRIVEMNECSGEKIKASSPFQTYPTPFSYLWKFLFSRALGKVKRHHWGESEAGHKKLLNPPRCRVSPPPYFEPLLIYGYAEHIHAALFLKPTFIFDVV